ncbi:MAG: NAD-dependent epimerase/dehydratase family protein [Pseudomonadota bacterium]
MRSLIGRIRIALDRILTKSKEARIETAAPDKVFITGALGFIGQALMERYRALGAEVCGMDLKADAEQSVVAGDLAEPQGWQRHAQGCEVFINTAATVSLAADWDTYRAGSLRGVRAALDVAIAAGARRFVHFSSVAALGYDYPDEADERTPVVIGPHYRYGVAKAGSEQVVLAAHAAGEIDCTIIRPGDVYGPGSRAWLIEPLTVARTGQLILPDEGRHAMTPVYIDDLVDGTLLAAGAAAGIGHVFILWSGEHVTCREFFAYHWRWAGRQGQPRSLPRAAALALTTLIHRANRAIGRQTEVTPDAIRMLTRRGRYSIAKARDRLGFAPQVMLAEGMRRSEEWLREIGELGGSA